MSCKHRTIWLVCGGGMCWCYSCGAIRPNIAGNPKHPIRWQTITKDGENPAMKKWYPALTWKDTQDD